MTQRKLFSARDIYMPRLRELREELRKTEQDNKRQREALRRAEAQETWAEIKASTWKVRSK